MSLLAPIIAYSSETSITDMSARRCEYVLQ